MSVTVTDDRIVLAGRCPVEDAEPLAAALAGGARRVELSACEQMHAAVLQALLAFDPEIVGEPADPFLRDYVAPQCRRAAHG